MNRVRHEILADMRNPSRADVIDAFDRAFDNEGWWIEFWVQDTHTQRICLIWVQVTGVEYKSKRSGMFNLKGNVTADEQVIGGFEAFYDANLRQGHILVDPTVAIDAQAA